MKKTFVVCVAALLYYGCERSIVSGPEEVRSATLIQVVVIDGFGDDTCMLTSSVMVRVGSYYNFRPFDSLRISFSATRMTTHLPFDEILVRIGPACYLRDSVRAMQKNVSLSVKVCDIAKPTFAALTFVTRDSLTILKISNLRVVGWLFN